MPSGSEAAAVSLAEEQARRSAETFRLGAVLLRGRRVLARGRNRNASACGLDSIHAEMDAVFRAGAPRKRASGGHLVVVRILRDGRRACSRPCAACLRALAKRGVDKVTYTDGGSVVRLRRRHSTWELSPAQWRHHAAV